MAKGQKSKAGGGAGSRKSGPFAKASGGPVLAVIDMGTNSFHMIICRARASRDGFDVISRVRDATPFFRKSLVNHFIDDEAQDAAVTILANMLNHADARDASTVVAVATSAVRESRNGQDSLNLIRAELNLNVRTLSGKEEARLIYLGVLFSMPDLSGRFAIVDIGGGSTEIIAADRKTCYFAESYKLGAARLTQRFFRKTGPTPESIEELHDEVRGELRPAAAAVMAAGGFKQLIGTSGTIQALAKLDRVQMGKPNLSLQGWKIPLSRLTELVSYIESQTLSGGKIKGVSSDRSETILAGAIVLLETMRSLNADSITVCTAALREGVVVDRFLQTGWLKGVLDDHRDPRSESVYTLVDKYGAGYQHAEHVAYLASIIFEQTRGVLHDYTDEEAHLLWAAAMLHDIGTHIGRKGHHKHSHYLIRNGGLLGHSEEEVAIIASVARYHRGSEPKDTHEAWIGLNESARPLVEDLSAILRIAEALDRSHRQVIESVKVTMSALDKKGRRPLTISLVPTLAEGEDCMAEAWALSEKKAYFESRFEVRLELLVETSSALAQSTSGAAGRGQS